ncbi:molecular chaperone [Escherichia coli]|nr:molecular chaperone [Escherichia coli]
MNMRWNFSFFYTGEKRFFLLLLCVWGPVWGGNINVSDGISLQSTRVIYQATKKRGITFTVTNDTQRSYLVQSRVVPWSYGPVKDELTEEHFRVPFVVTPPLSRIEAGDTLSLHIRQFENTLPKNRESVFAFQIKSIPGQSDGLGDKKMPPLARGEPAKVVLALQNTLKLFYRPDGLPEYDAELISQSLQFQRKGNQLVVMNPSAFYVTFYALTVGNKAVEDKALLNMVPPFGEQTYPLKKISLPGEVRWRILDDYRTPTEQKRRILSR